MAGFFRRGTSSSCTWKFRRPTPRSRICISPTKQQVCTLHGMCIYIYTYVKSIYAPEQAAAVKPAVLLADIATFQTNAFGHAQGAACDFCSLRHGTRCSQHLNPENLLDPGFLGKNTTAAIRFFYLLTSFAAIVRSPINSHRLHITFTGRLRAT